MNTNALPASTPDAPANTVEVAEVTVVTEHAVCIKAGKSVLVSFRVKPGQVPAWFPRRTKRQCDNDGDESENGIQVMFDISADETPLLRPVLHSVAHECEEFEERFSLANAYWDMIPTQKGPRPVLYFWFHHDASNLHPNKEFLSHCYAFFRKTALQTWDYVNAYENPGNVAIVYKGGSQKPARHFVCCEK